MSLLRAVAVFFFGAAFSSWALADEVRILAAGAAKHALQTIAPAFQTATGHTIKSEYDTVGALRDRVLKAAHGGAADVVILSDEALQSLRTASRLADTPYKSIGRVVVAVAVRKDAPLPGLGDSEALRRILLAASSIAYGDPQRGATAGTHFSKVVDDLGLRNVLRAKMTILPFGVDVVMGVAEGRYAIGISQSSEIMQHQGVRYAGPLPAPYGLSTGYGAALVHEGEAAQSLLEFLVSPQALAVFAASGFVR